MTRSLPLFLCFALHLFAGPPLACFRYAAAPGSLFERIQALSEVVLDSDDHPEASRARIEILRAAARADDAVSLVEAGYAIQAMNQMWKKTDPDGMRFLKAALALRPDDAEIHFVLALAHADGDKNLARQHAEKARRLAKEGAPVLLNLQKAARVLP